MHSHLPMALQWCSRRLNHRLRENDSRWVVMPNWLRFKQPITPVAPSRGDDERGDDEKEGSGALTRRAFIEEGWLRGRPPFFMSDWVKADLVTHIVQGLS